jgi:hypothetical protein
MKKLILFLCCIFLMCAKQPKSYTLVIIDIYQTKVNDGKVAKLWRTVFRILETGGQDIADGKHGNIGDTLYNMKYDFRWKPEL